MGSNSTHLLIQDSTGEARKVRQTFTPHHMLGGRSRSTARDERSFPTGGSTKRLVLYNCPALGSIVRGGVGIFGGLARWRDLCFVCHGAAERPYRRSHLARCNGRASGVVVEEPRNYPPTYASVSRICSTPAKYPDLLDTRSSARPRICSRSRKGRGIRTSGLGR